MAKVIGTGETVTDIIIRNGQPETMVCGGSCFNSMISLGRAGVESVFIGQVGGDRLGLQTRDFLEANGVSAEYLRVMPGQKSQLSLAFLNEKNDAEYVFYKDHAADIFPDALPPVEHGDVVLYGSFFALNDLIHPALSAFLSTASERGALIYYDVNFRASHLADKERLAGEMLDNFQKATLVRGSDEDFLNIFGTADAAEVYAKIRPHCENLIITRGGKSFSVITPSFTKDYDVPAAQVVSTIGAGDSFNAGFVYGIVSRGIAAAQLPTLAPSDWDFLTSMAQRFSLEVCGTTDNYISAATGDVLKAQSRNL